jgi:eukaryotic-like serine/threonine-protein kinase
MNVQPSFDIASLVGQTLDGKVRLESILGRGGMGAVYRGKHLLLGRAVAVKVLRPEFVADESATERFFREARTAAALDHPNVITVFDFGMTPTGGAYLVLELIDGILLRTLLRQETALKPNVALPILRETFAAVEAAHRKGVIHRDLKPENIMLKRLDEGGAMIKVLDFGLAKVIEAAETAANLTQTGELVGTPTYMSPEHCDGTDLDARSDVYSLGVIAYELLTGKPPFRGRIASILTGHMQKEPPPPREMNPDIPAEIEAVVLNALEKRRGDRPASVREFWDCLEDAYVASYGEGSPVKISLVISSLKDSSQHNPTLMEESPSSSFAGVAATGLKPERPTEDASAKDETERSAADAPEETAAVAVARVTEFLGPAGEGRETLMATRRSGPGEAGETLHQPLGTTIATARRKRRRAYVVAGISVAVAGGATAVALGLQAARPKTTISPSAPAPAHSSSAPAATPPPVTTTTVIPAGAGPVTINVNPAPAPSVRTPSERIRSAPPSDRPGSAPPVVDPKPGAPPAKSESKPAPKLEPPPLKPAPAPEAKREPTPQPEAKNEGGFTKKVGDGAKKTFQGVKKIFGGGKDKKDAVRN